MPHVVKLRRWICVGNRYGIVTTERFTSCGVVRGVLFSDNTFALVSYARVLRSL